MNNNKLFGNRLLIFLAFMTAFAFSVGVANATLTTQLKACAGSSSCTNFVSVNSSGNWYIDVNQTIAFQGSATGGSDGCYEASSPYEQYGSCPPASGSYYVGNYFFRYDLGGPLSYPSEYCPGGSYYYNQYWGSPSSGPANYPTDSPFPTFFIKSDGSTGLAFTEGYGGSVLQCYTSVAGYITPVAIDTFDASNPGAGDAYMSYNVVINPALTTPTLTVSNSFVDVGTPISFTANDWTGGTMPYTVQLAQTSPTGSNSCSTLAGATNTIKITSNTINFSVLLHS